MVSRLPPLKPLPAFEAAARLLSFTEAADELFVTQAAISHQIKQLEDALGVRLFRRLNRALLLTEEGQAFAGAVRQALSQIATAADRVKRQDASGALNVSCLPSFASAWLVPRLARFRARHPEIDVRLSADYELTDFTVEDIDLAIRWGTGGYDDLYEIRMMTEEVFPVCSPRLLQDPEKPLEKLEDLRHHTLLHDDIRTDWRVWLTAAGVTGVNPDKGPRYNYSNLVLQAAMAGEGIALGRSAIAHDALEQGLLVKPFDFSIPSDYAYWVVCPKDRADHPKIKAFTEWLLDEASLD
ncbi:MAG: transcriptional regulator GcvA [Alphaproteobacteria bacterium]|nr:transcriptional regulator GcvA [Alphaproteobacteria bacterium]